MGWFSKKDDSKKDEPKAVEAAAPPPAAARAAPEPRPAPPAPAPQATAPAPPPAAAPPRPAAPAPSAAAAQPMAAPPAASSAGDVTSVKPDTDPTRTFAALMRVALLAPQTQRLSVEQLRAIIEPAIATGQFVVAATGGSSAAVLWATVSDEIDARLRTDLGKPFDIGADDWRTGSHAWLVAIMGDTNTARQLIDMIGRGPLKGAPLHARMTTPEGEPGIATFTRE